jgi:hypothetical protein
MFGHHLALDLRLDEPIDGLGDSTLLVLVFAV